MQQLLDDWQRTRNPRTCPHGRPIYLALNESDLSRFFRRSWTVCSQQWGNGLGTGKNGTTKERKLGDRFSADILGSNRVEQNQPPHEP